MNAPEETRSTIYLLYERVSAALPVGLTIRDVVVTVLAVSTVHFAGFLSSIPKNLQQIVIINFTDTFLSLFYFYLALAYLGARVIPVIMFGMATSAINVGLRLIGRKISDDEYERLPSSIIFGTLQIAIFLVLYVELYHETPFAFARIWRDVAGGLFSFFLTFEGLLGAIFVVLIISIPITSKRKVEETNAQPDEGSRSDHERKAVSRNSIRLILSFLLTLFYFSGVARGHFLWLSNPIVVQDGRIAGRYNVVMQSGDSKILVEHNGLYDRHIISTPNGVFYELVGVGVLGEEFRFPWSPAYREKRILDEDGKISGTVEIQHGTGVEDMDSVVDSDSSSSE